MQTVVELEGVNGEWFTLAGPNAGDKGVYLGKGVKGMFYDPPVKVVMEEPGNYPGARYLNHRILRRDIVFRVEILNDPGANSWLSRDSEWRKAWSFDRDCKMYVTTEESGTRYLKLRLLESPEIDTDTDPHGRVVNHCLMTCVSGDPFWYEDDVIYEVTTQDDTTFDPNPLPWPWPKEELPTETLYIEVDPEDGKGGLNPTDQPIWPKWIVPGSTEKPAEPYIPWLPWLGAPNSPATIWTIPDYNFESDDPALADRRIRMPGLIGGLWTNEIQKIYVEGRPTGGTFNLQVGEEATWPLPYNASTAQIKAALEGLALVALNDVKVTRDRRVNEVQYIDVVGGATGGTYTLEFDGDTTNPIPYNANSIDVWARLNSLSSISAWDIKVTEEVAREEQTVTLVGEPTSGTFTLTLDGHTTAPIPWNAGAIRMHNALVALPNIDLFDITVTRQWNKYAPWKIRFNGNGLAGVNVSTLVGDPTNLSGGAGIDVKVETVTEGFHRYRVEFRDELAAYNLPQMTSDPSGLTGGDEPDVVITTEVNGSHPYVVEFQNGLAGAEIPLMVGHTDFTGYIGTLEPYVRCEVVQEGITYPGENAVIDSDPRVEQVAAENGAEIWARMNGVRWRHPVPPYTKSKVFEITVSGAVPGQLVTLRLPRAWTRPWGLE